MNEKAKLTWHEAVTTSNKYVLTNPLPGVFNVWRKTKSGRKSRTHCGWDIVNELREMPAVAKLWNSGIIPHVYKDHISF